MTRYNHFALCPYRELMFKQIEVGQKFRRRIFRNYVVYIKTGELTFMAVKRKLHGRFENTDAKVYEYSRKEGK